MFEEYDKALQGSLYHIDEYGRVWYKDQPNSEEIIGNSVLTIGFVETYRGIDIFSEAFHIELNRKADTFYDKNQLIKHAEALIKCIGNDCKVVVR